MDTTQRPLSPHHKDDTQTIENSPKQPDDNEDVAGRDRAAVLLQNSHEAVILTPQDNARLLKRIDLVILPIMLGVYFLQQLDKSTLSYASVFGLVDDAHLGGEDYSWLGSIGK